MATSIGDRFSFDDLKARTSFDGLPPFPDLDSATETGEETAPKSADDGGGGTEAAAPKEDAPAGDSADANDTDNDEGGTNAADDTDTARGTDAAHDANDRDDTGDEAGNGGEVGGDGRETDDADDTADNDDTAVPAGGATEGSGPTGDPGGSGDPEGLRQGYLPERTLKLLPELLEKPARRIGDRRKRDVFLTGALPMWAGALPNVRFRYGGNDLSPNLYSAVVAPPASGKSALRHVRRYGTPLREELSAGGPAAEAPLATEAPEDDTSRDGRPGDRGPTRQRLFLAADSSAAALKEGLADSPHGVIFETEFRTLSQALESSWGTFTDVLLKGFQNETIKMSRSSTGTVTISHPAPSIALAGTPATFDGVISGTSDGLFSRFLFYRFNREFEWSTQFGESGAGLEQCLRDAAEDFQVGYRRLQARGEPLRVTVPEALQQAHDRAFHSLTEKWRNDENVGRSLQASLTRAGLQAVKIAVVLRGIRLAASGIPPAPTEPVELGAEDMEAGLRLALTYLLHAVRVETRFREETSVRASLTERKRTYLDALPKSTFSTAEAKGLASQVGASERNVQRWLKDWREAGLLTKPKRGRWAKLSPELEGIAGAESVISVINDIPALPSSSPA